MYKDYQFDTYHVYEIGLMYNGNTKRIEFGVVFHLTDCKITNKAYLKGILTDKFCYGTFDYDMTRTKKHEQFEITMEAEFTIFKESILQSLYEHVKSNHYDMPANIQKEILHMIKQHGAI